MSGTETKGNENVNNGCCCLGLIAATAFVGYLFVQAPLEEWRERSLDEANNVLSDRYNGQSDSSLVSTVRKNILNRDRLCAFEILYGRYKEYYGVLQDETLDPKKRSEITVKAERLLCEIKSILQNPSLRKKIHNEQTKQNRILGEDFGFHPDPDIVGEIDRIPANQPLLLPSKKFHPVFPSEEPPPKSTHHISSRFSLSELSAEGRGVGMRIAQRNIQVSRNRCIVRL